MNQYIWRLGSNAIAVIARAFNKGILDSSLKRMRTYACKRDAELYLFKKGYDIYEKRVYIKFVKENFEFIAGTLMTLKCMHPNRVQGLQ